MTSPAPVGVVIATRDRRERLLTTLERVTALPERPPVVVVDNGSRDGTPAAVAERFPEVEVVALHRDCGTGARNVGIRRMGTRFVAFLDDDSWWAPGALGRAVALLEGHPRVGLLAARVLVGSERRLDPACVAMARSPLQRRPAEPGPAVLGFVACAAVARRDALLAVGGFDEHYGFGGEELRLAIALAAAGWELRYAADVVAHHHPTRSATRAGRNATVLCNDLWTAWAVRPRAAALRATARLVRAAGWRRDTLDGVLAALRGARRIARERRVAPPAVEIALQILECRSQDAQARA